MNIKHIIIGTAFALAALSSQAFGAEIKLCSGSGTGVYYDAAERIKSAAGRTLEIINIETVGAGENIDRLINGSEDDSCDAVIVQPDAMIYNMRANPSLGRQVIQVGTLHREYLHALCGKGTVSDIGKLENDPGKYSLAIGDEGSGAWYTWQNLIAEDEDYAPVKVVALGGSTALSSISVGDTTCGLFPVGLGGGTINEANDLYSDTIDLVGVNDNDFNDSVGIDGKPIYEFSEIPGGTYNNLRSWSDTDTISWLARVYISNSKVSDKKTREAFIRAVAKASVDIKNRYGK